MLLVDLLVGQLESCSRCQEEDGNNTSIKDGLPRNRIQFSMKGSHGSKGKEGPPSFLYCFIYGLRG